MTDKAALSRMFPYYHIIMNTTIRPKADSDGYVITLSDKKKFLSIMLPALVEGIITQLFGMIDTLMLGNTADSAVNISAVSISGAPLNFIVCVLAAFTIGTTTAVAYYHGRGEDENVSAAARQSFTFVLITSTAAAAAALIFSDRIVNFAGAKGELHGAALTYFRIVAVGIPIQMLTSVATAAMRGIGVTSIAMTYNLVSGGSNVILNYCLIYGHFGFPEMGVAGAAWATNIAKVIAFVIAAANMFLVVSPVQLHFHDSYGFTKPIIGRVCSVGLTTAAEQVILQGGNILATRITSYLDTNSIAAMSICSNIEGIGWKTGQACQVATTTFTGYDMGEGMPVKAKKRSLMVYRYSLYMAAAVIVFIIFTRFYIAKMFTTVEEVWRLAGGALIIDAVSNIGVTTHLVLSGSLRAAGDSKYPLIASLVSLWVFRVIMLYIILKLGGLNVYTGRIGIAADQMVRGTIVALRFFTSEKYRRKES